MPNSITRKLVGVRIDDHLWAEVRIEALKRGITASAATETALRTWLTGHPQTQEKPASSPLKPSPKTVPDEFSQL